MSEIALTPVPQPAPLTPTAPLWQPCLLKLYESVGEDQRLCEALADFRPYVQASSVVLVTAMRRGDGEIQHTASVGVPPESILEYNQHFCVHDIWVRAGVERGLWRPGVVAYSDELVPREQLESSYFWKDFLVRYGTIDALAAVIEGPSEHGGITFITFHRQPGSAPFGPAEKAQVSEWMPHFANALRLHRRLTPQLAIGQTLEEMFELCSTPMLYLDAGGVVRQCNGAAQRLFAHEGGSVRLGPDGRLLMQEGLRWRDARDSVSRLVSGSDQSLEHQTRNETGVLSQRLILRRVNSTRLDLSNPEQAAAVCMIEAIRGTDPATLALRFRFTPTEARVANLLLQGQSTEQVAQSLGVSMATIRSHLSALFNKTGTARQAALVAFLKDSDGPAH